MEAAPLPRPDPLATSAADLLDSLAERAAIVDADGRVVAVNRAWARFAADGSHDLELPAPARDLLGPAADLDAETAVRLDEMLRAVLDGGDPVERTARSRVASGDVHYRIRVAPMPGGALVTHAPSRPAARSLSHAAPVVMLALDAAGRTTFVNTRWLAATGFTPAGDRPHDWLRAVPRDDRPALRSAVANCLESASEFRVDARLLTDAGLRWHRFAGQTELDDDGEVDRVVITALDVHAERREAARLAHEASHDALTGVPNRTTFFEHLDVALARLARRPGGVAVLFVDLDHFKELNDTHGHAAGDRALTVVAQRLRRAVRPSDIVARFGGDEFVVLLDDVESESAAREVGDRLLDHLQQPVTWREEVLPVGASVGLAFTDRAMDGSQLVRTADEALYRVKQSGRGRIAAVPDPDQARPTDDSTSSSEPTIPVTKRPNSA